MGKFAHWLHVTPREVDTLDVMDFVSLVVWCDSYEASIQAARG